MQNDTNKTPNSKEYIDWKNELNRINSKYRSELNYELESYLLEAYDSVKNKVFFQFMVNPVLPEHIKGEVNAAHAKCFSA